jgi:hypothetical protein
VPITYTASDYFRILGLPENSTAEDIKKAYRKMARQYHPDINHDPGARDLFIQATEAYEFLMTYIERAKRRDQAFQDAMEEWRKYRQQRSREKARVYARTSYIKFRNTKFYRSTRILDATGIIIGFAISVLVIVYTIYGFLWRVKNPLPHEKSPPVVTFLMLLLLGFTFLSVSLIYLVSYIDQSSKNKKQKKGNWHDF